MSREKVAHPNLPSSAPTCNDQFNVVSSQNSGMLNNELNSVSAISSSDTWAVGDFDLAPTGPTSIVAQPQAQHWDGSS